MTCLPPFDFSVNAPELFTVSGSLTSGSGSGSLNTQNTQNVINDFIDYFNANINTVLECIINDAADNISNSDKITDLITNLESIISSSIPTLSTPINNTVEIITPNKNTILY